MPSVKMVKNWQINKLSVELYLLKWICYFSYWDIQKILFGYLKKFYMFIYIKLLSNWHIESNRFVIIKIFYFQQIVINPFSCFIQNFVLSSTHPQKDIEMQHFFH